MFTLMPGCLLQSPTKEISDRIEQDRKKTLLFSSFFLTFSLWPLDLPWDQWTLYIILSGKKCWLKIAVILQKTYQISISFVIGDCSWGEKKTNPNVLEPYVLCSGTPWYLMQIANSLQKSLMLGKIEGRRRRRRHGMRWLDGNTDAMDMKLGKL